ncbi:hypothetical protein NESM_000860800 [Novymonas esmeraldas]|uniref:Uncharacterized protein n=1 Tax=Novymonas esmeraldas TaxID=1808958 RepID=A0AAW0EXS5_9TRYP
MVRELTVETANEQLEVDAAEIVQLEELRILGDVTFVIRRVTPPQMTRLHSLAVVNCTAEVADFVVDLPSLTELSIYNCGSTAVSMREPACAAQLLRLSISNPTMDTLTWIERCTSVTHLGLRKCTFEINLRLLSEVPHLTTLDTSESDLHHLHGLQRCMELGKIDATRCSR